MATSRTTLCKATVAFLIILSVGSDSLNVLPSATSGQQLQEGIALGASWSANSLSYIASPEKSFCFGWLQFPSASPTFYVAVWYGGLDGSIVWMANRNTPAAANDTLQFTSDGNLQLVSASAPNPTWQTNTGSTGISALQVLDSGNVVLLYKNGSYSWQSFSSPTDTLLPSQTFLVSSTLVSRLPDVPTTSLASGNFMFYINSGLASIDYVSASTGKSISNLWEASSAVYVPVSAINSSGIAGQFLIDGIFCMYSVQNGSVFSQFVPSDYGTSSAPSGSGANFRRLTLDPDGNLRMYGWDYVSGSWIVLSEAIWAFCAYLATNEAPACGPYGVCVDAPKPACACPPGFSPANIHNVNTGCTPSNLTLPTCQNNQSSVNSSDTVYLKLPNTNFYGNDMLSKAAISVADCQSLCTSLCSCVGLIYNDLGAATCWLKNTLANGYSPPMQGGASDAYIKIQNTPSFPVINPLPQSPILAWMNSSAFWSQALLQLNISTYKGSSNSTCPSSVSPLLQRNSQKYITKRASRVMVTVVSLIEFLCFLLALLFIRRTSMCRDGRKTSPTHPAVCRAFTYAELVEATDHFKYPLGSGAFGDVFKGVLSEGTEIAVKRLQTNVLQIADTQFRAEIATLGRIHHMNLLRLYGFCAEGPDHRLLVYEFMEKGSLNSALFQHNEQTTLRQGPAMEESNDQRRRSLKWKTRYNICLGTARGLAYLHEDCLDCIVHCDIKPENILLDGEFCPRVADFGLAYLFGRNETVQMSNVRGTRGYLAPEWVTNMAITAKADVFSYGMVLIEIVTGRRNFRFTPSVIATDRWDYPRWVFQQVRSGLLARTVDQTIRTQVLEDDAARKEVESVLSIAFLCLHREANARPSMRGIVQMLEGSIPVPPLPAGPGSFQEQAENLAYDDAELPQGLHFSDGEYSLAGVSPESLQIASAR